MTQSIVQGIEDPLLVLDHQGGSGNPSFVIQQDENAAAYIWWDQVNQVFNMGPASVGRPSLSITSDGAVHMAVGMIGLKVVDLLVGGTSGGGMQAEAANISQLTAGGLVVQNGGTLTGGLVADAANISQLTAGGLVVQNGGTLTGGLVADAANIIQLTARGLVVQQGGTLTGGLVADAANISQLTAGGLVVQNGAGITNGLDVDNVLVSGTITAGNYLVSSSKEIKENITNLSSQEALEVLGNLSPVKFNLKADNAKKEHIGFIAENVHPSVASSDGKSVSLMDLVAVLTQVVKEQQKTIDALVAKSH